MSKVIYKYRLFGHKTVVRLPYRSDVLSIDIDPQNYLCMWAIHDLDDEKGREVEYEVLVQPTGVPTDEPLWVLGECPEDGFGFFKTIVIKEYVWHIFLRMNIIGE
jgi:hypothetical protein